MMQNKQMADPVEPYEYCTIQQRQMADPEKSDACWRMLNKYGIHTLGELYRALDNMPALNMAYLTTPPGNGAEDIDEDNDAQWAHDH